MCLLRARLTDHWNAVRLSVLVVEAFLDAERPHHVTQSQCFRYRRDDVTRAGLGRLAGALPLHADRWRYNATQRL